MRVWLTRKYAECIDDVDLSGRKIGDVLDLPPREAALLIAEQWALPDRRETSASKPPKERRRSNTPGSDESVR
jgi:hypothetical protein